MKTMRRNKKSLPDERIRINEAESPGFAQTYAVKERKRFSLDREKRHVIYCGAGMLVVLILSFLFVGDMTDQNMSVAYAGHYGMRRIKDFFDAVTGNHTQSDIILFLCQFLCPMFCGIALASSGACFQGVFHNPMASPTMLGVESGGTLGASLYVIFFGTTTYSQLLNSDYEGYATEYHAMDALQKYGEYFATFIGCLAVVFFILVITKITGRNRIRTIPLLIGGSVFTTLVNSVLQAYEYFMVQTGKNVMIVTQVQQITSGKFQNVLLPAMLLYMAVPIVISFVLLLLFAGRLNIIALGDEEARTMGVSVEKDRNVVLIISTLLTAAVVAFCGTIGFVGLVVPHIARHAAGSDFRHMVPAAAFLGGIFMILAYDISYMCHGLIDPALVINSVGGVFFMFIMIRYRRQGNADWA